MNFRLEPATDSQLKTLMTWLPDRRQCLQWGGPQFLYPFTEQTFFEDCRWRDLPSYALVNAERELLGFGQFYDRLGRCHLGRLIVSPQHRGAGLGKALVTKLVQQGCGQLDARECSLFVLKDNISAQRLYEKLGFREAAYPELHDWLAGCNYMIAPSENLLRRVRRAHHRSKSVGAAHPTSGSMNKLIEPQTERLQLRQWRDEDRTPFADLNADPQVMEYFPATLDRAASDAAVDRLSAHIAEHGWGFWAVERREDGKFIGFVGLQHAPPELPFSPCVEIGWRLAPSYWGRGYASEAANTTLCVAFEELQLREVVSFTALQNIRSQRVMQRLGMCEDSQVFEHPRVPAGSPLRRHCLYRLTSAEWRERMAAG